MSIKLSNFEDLQAIHGSLATSPEMIAVQTAIQSNDLEAVTKALNGLKTKQFNVPMIIYETCARYEVSTEVYEAIFTKLKIRHVVFSLNVHTPQYIAIACKHNNKTFLQWVHGKNTRHVNIFVVAMQERCSISMLQWIEETFGVFPENTQAIAEMGYNDYGSSLKELSLIYEDELLNYCFNCIFDKIVGHNMQAFMLNFAIQNKNLGLIKLMDANNLLDDIESIHCNFFLDGFQFLYQKNYEVQLSNNFFHEWNKVIEQYIIIRNDSENNMYKKVYMMLISVKNSYDQLVRAFHTSKFWRETFLENVKIDGNLPALDTVLKEELAKIEMMKARVRSCMPQIPDIVVEWAIGTMF